jgi:hypothetical protein
MLALGLMVVLIAAFLVYSNTYVNFPVINLMMDNGSPRPDLQPVLLLVLLLQPLVGMYLGAPLVAGELEQGTYRLIWTQGVTRLRWLAVKVSVQMGVILLVFALLSLLVMWWNNGPFEPLGGGVRPLPFDLEGVVPLAYAAYALSLAIAAGTVLRKTVPAMVVTLLGYLAARIPIDALARPRYLPPLSVTWDPYTTPSVHKPFRATALMGPYNGPDWVFYLGWVNHAGQPIDPDNVYRVCNVPDNGALPGSPLTACTHTHGWLYMLTWQPPDRFWLFQGIESAIFFALAAALLALAFWWVRTRIS